MYLPTMFHRHNRPSRRNLHSKNNSSDEEEDEHAGEVFYREQSQQAHPPSAAAVASSQSQLSQSQSQFQESNNNATAAVIQLLPRHERKRRAREMAIRNYDYCSMSSSEDSSQAGESSAIASNGKETNAFASLENMLNQQPEHEQVLPPPEVQADDSMEQEREVAHPNISLRQFESTVNAPVLPVASTTEPAVAITAHLTSAASLPRPMMREEHGIDSLQTDNASEVYSFLSDVHSGSQATTTIAASNTNRPRHSRDWRDNLPTPSYTTCSPPASNLDDSSSFLLEKTRRMAMKQHARINSNNNHNTATKEQPLYLSTNTLQANVGKSQKPAAIVQSKSIVGTRPKHWGGSMNVRRRVTNGRGPLARQKSRGLAAELSKAAQIRTLMPPSPRAMPPTMSAKRARTETVGNVPMDPAPSTDGSPFEKNATFSFTPAFLSSRVSEIVPAEQVEGVDSAFPETLTTTNLSPRFGCPSGMFSPPTRKSGKSKTNKTGPLCKRLKVLRDAVKGDSVRFQSGQYRFSVKSTFDLNDPRNRAKSYMDVTVLGESCSWAGKDSQRVTVLVFIHAHCPTHSTDAGDVALVSQKCLAWLCVSFETARAQNIRTGSELRLYNAVAVPLTLPSDALDVNARFVVVAQLCEPYPAVLEKLPDAASIANTVQGQSSEA